MEPPQVPQRPSRSTGNTLTTTPTVPPRPSRQTSDGTNPPPQIELARSPLNASPFQPPEPVRPTDALSDLHKTSSVSTLPLVGEEGMEYESLSQAQKDAAAGAGLKNKPSEPEHTSNVSGDLPIHAPQASSASITMRSKVEPMTRIDSTAAASAGLAKPYTEYDDSHELPSRSKEYRPASASSNNRPTSRAHSSRPESMHGEEHEHGIPAIGVQVPMYPNAGDVQAPSSANSQGPPSAGVGFFNSTSSHRRKSSQGFYGPPGSYGLHGHGVLAKDQFEKDWYQKHPEELSKEEHGAYGPGMHVPRSQWALSSDDLNKIIHDRPARTGASPSFPSEDIGYRVSEEYSSRMNSPQLKAVKSRTSSQTYAESPLRKASYPDQIDDAHAFDSEDDENVHLGPPKSSTPYLASDEVKKRPGGELLQPAVSPSVEKFDNDDYFPLQQVHSHGSSRSGKPRSRPGSAKFHHDFENRGTHLTEIEEYEPLFKDDDNQGSPKNAAVTRLKRPELEKHRFPSQDIWEDTPTSLQLSTEIDGPEDQDENPSVSVSRVATFETPQEELQRSKTAESDLSRQRSFLDDEEYKLVKARSSALHHDNRHFPSRDIWEDTPDSLNLVTTVDEAQEIAAQKQEDRLAGENTDKPSVPARPTRSKDADISQTQPSVPPRPAQRSTQISSAESTVSSDRQAPAIPDRPKPQVPARPKKTSIDDYADGEDITKTTSAGSTGSVEPTSPTDRSITSPTTGKAKPAVPSKPSGSSKFASIKAGFMDDLNSRLQLGPQQKKPAQPEVTENTTEEDKAPLTDARKARARGPVRRKPAESAASGNAASDASGWSIVQPWNVWSISNSDGNDLVMGKPSISFTPASSDDKQTAPPPEEPSEPLSRTQDQEVPVLDQETNENASASDNTPDKANIEQTNIPETNEEVSEAAGDTSGKTDKVDQANEA